MEEKPSGVNFWKIGFFGLLVIIVILANIFAWYFFVRGKEETTSLLTAPSPTPQTVTEVTATPTLQAAIFSLTPTIDETNLIKQAIFKLTGLNETKAEITINKNTGTHAKGNIKEFEAVGGAYWLAAKTESGWIGVYAGQATPKCSDIAPYNFPKDMVPECLNESGTVVER